MPTSTYVALQTTTLGATASSVTFGSLPTGLYRDLVIVINGSSTAATNWRVRFNSDTGSNYGFVVAYGNGSGGSGDISNAYSSETQGTYVLGSYSGTTSQTSSILQLLDFSATDKHKVFLARTDSASTATEMFANRWASTSAITAIELYPEGTTWTVGSVFSIYGIAS